MAIISKSSVMCVDFTIKGEEVCKYIVGNFSLQFRAFGVLYNALNVS